MKISTSLEHAIGQAGVSARESARMMKRAGFDGVDLDMCKHQMEPEKLLLPAWREDILHQAEALKAEGLEIAQCHLPFYPGHIPLPGAGRYEDFEDFMLPEYMRALEVCREIGCHTAVMHPFFILGEAQATWDGNVRMIEKLMPYLKEWKVRLALENVYGFDGNYADSHMSRGEDIMQVLRRTEAEWVGACIDTGHANIFRLPIGDMARLFGKRLFALHVNGNAGKDEHAIPYSMSDWCECMDFHDFSAALKEIGYNGFYNLEIASGPIPRQAAQPFLDYAAAVARGLADEAE